MSELLPLFPLGSVLFPGALMPLHIFEPRYRLLIRRCMDRHHPFGIVLIRHGSEVGPSAEPYEVGTEAKIVAESPLPDGRSYVVTRGERRFAVESVIPDAEPYLVGRVRYLDENDGEAASDRARTALDALGAYLLAVVAVTEDPRGERALADDLREARPRDLAYRIAGSLAVDAPQHQALLELETASARLEEETRILNRETELLRDLLVRLRERGERPDLN
ncbi:MAG: peptidase S16 [Chloroflexi bacterium]|nr:MAG: peptidase S16 [Chloroflexota bacterium]